MKPEAITKRLFELAEPAAKGAGYDLVDIQFRREQAGWVVRVYIDSPLGINFDDCERVSRELSAVLDVEDLIPQAYSLEVSSPGLDRPLRTSAHFARYIGSEAKLVLAQPVDARRNFRGIIVSVEPASDSEAGGGPAIAGDRVVMEVDGKRFRLPIGAVESARLVPDWDAVLHGGAAVGGKAKKA